VVVNELVYDWNNIQPSIRAPQRHIGFDDETLRDGLQSPSVREPTVEKKIELLHLMNALDIDTADIGLLGAGGTHAAGVERLAKEIANQKLKIRPNCAARRLKSRLKPALCAMSLRSPFASGADTSKNAGELKMCPPPPPYVRGVGEVSHRNICSDHS